MADLEIRVSKRGTASFAGERREAQALEGDLKRVERAAKIDGKVNVDDSEIDLAKRKVNDLDDKKITIPVDIDDSEVEPAARRIEDRLSDIDLSDMGGSISSQLQDMLGAAGPAGAMVAGLGAVVAGEFIDGFSAGFHADRNRARLAVQTGLSDADLRAAGAAGGDAYVAGFGDSLGDLRGMAATIEQNLGGIDDALDLTEATRQASVLADVFERDLNESLVLTRRLIANDLVSSTEGAFDLMTRSAQEFGANSEELIEVLNEFSPVFSKLEISGAQALGTMGAMVQEGLLPNVDRAAELFEEFNIRLSETDTLRPVIGRLGLDFETMQRMLASGRGGDALEEIARALLEIEEPAERNAVALEIFGASIESAADPQRVLEILAVGEALEEVEGAASQAAAATEENANWWQRLQREVVDGASMLGSAVGGVLDAYQQFDDWMAKHQGLNDAEEEAEAAAEAAEQLAESQKRVTEHFMRANDATEETRDQYSELSTGTSELEERMAELAAAADRTESALRSLSDWADDSGESALRSVHAAADELSEALNENVGAAFSAREGWNLLSEEGRAGSEMASNLRQDIAELTEAYLQGEVGPRQFHAAMNDLEGQLREAAVAAGLSKAEVDALVASILEVPGRTEAEVAAKTAGAKADLATINAQLDGIDGRHVHSSSSHHHRRTETMVREWVTRGRRFRRAGGLVGGDVPAAQSGGVQNGLTLVGEEGPELVDLAPGSNVFTTPDTQRMLSSGSGSAPSYTFNVAGSILSERDIQAIVRDALLQGGMIDAFTSGSVTSSL